MAQTRPRDWAHRGRPQVHKPHSGYIIRVIDSPPRPRYSSCSMHAIKSIVRWFFGLQAVVLILFSAVGIFGSLVTHPGVHPAHVASSYLHPAFSVATGYGVLAACAALGAVFAMAWWTIRRPSAAHNMWAIAASLVYLAEGIVYFVYLRRYGHSPTSGLDMLAIGAAGLFIFFRRENVPDPAMEARRRTPVAGDRTSVWTRHSVTGLSVVAQIAAIVVWGRWAYTHELFRTRGFMWIGLVALASILTTVVHECGHAIVAWCFEMGLVSFKAGPFQWAKREGKWKFKFHPAGLLTAGGAVGAVPTNPEQPRWEEMLMIFAGPLANLMIGGPAIWAVLHDRWATYQHSWEFVAFTGSFCLIAALLNLFPFMSEEGCYSDGARILQIVSRSPLDDYHRTMASIASTAITARRPRDLDIAAIERAAGHFPDEFREVHLRLCACGFYEDSGRLPEASAALAAAEAIYNNFSVELPGPLHTIFVIGHAYLNRDAVAARIWWDRMEAKKNERSNVDYWLAKTALHWIEGNFEEAEEAWQKADFEARNLPQFGAYEFDRSRCAMLREALDHSLQAVEPVLAAKPVIIRIPAAATRTSVVQPAPAAIRPAAPIMPASVSLPMAALMTDRTIAPAATDVFDPLARLFATAPAQTPTPIPAAVAAERLPTIDASAVPSTQIGLQAAPAAIVTSAGIASAPIAAKEIAPISETPSMPVDTTRGPASFTRIPASSIVASETPFTRISLLAVAGQGSASPGSTGVPPSSKAPAVPAAFARRPVNPVPAPPTDLYAELAVNDTAAPPVAISPATSALTPATAIVAIAPTLAPAALIATAPPPPVAAPNVARFDPLEFIRAAALENLAT
jgi:tetratricopeptide (TPR) repeat protein